MKSIAILSFCVVLTSGISAQKNDNLDTSLKQSYCTSRQGRCSNSDECCRGTACFQGTCSDSLYKNNRGPPMDQVKIIETEMATGNNVDVSAHPNINLLPSLDECGQSWLNLRKPHSRRKRIVGGTTYKEGKYPWAVALHTNYVNEGKAQDSIHCGASIISKRHIITAAHCVTRISSGVVLKYATLGTIDRRIKIDCETHQNCTSDEHYVDAEIEDFTVHEGYSDGNARNDLALLRLKQDINFTEMIQPVCLPRSEKIFRKWQDGKMTVVGWGAQNTVMESPSPSKIPYVAKELDMVLVHRSSCDRFFTRHIGKVRRSQICAVAPPGEADCGGDSGGPLFKKVDVSEELISETKEERYFQFGIVSTGADRVCGLEGKPSVFTNLVDFMPWILDHLVPKPKILGESVARVAVYPVEEFATGFNMNVRNHRNVVLLPRECGKIEGQQDHNGPARSNSHFRVKRIVGGIVQSIGAFPWMAQVYTKQVVTTVSDFECGGVLITSRHVLTAAHCVADLRGPFALEGVMLGNFNRKEKTECLGTECINQVIVPIEEVFVHDGFNKYAREHDIAIIKLAHEVTFNRFIQPICLPLSEDIIPKAWPQPQIDRRYVAAGWGSVIANDDPQEAGNYSSILIGTNFTLESKKYCEGALVRRNGKMENTRICGGGSIPGRGECNGDTGGPMMRWVTEEMPDSYFVSKMYAFGILSVVECAHQGIPSLYVNLLYHMPWLMDHLDA